MVVLEYIEGHDGLAIITHALADVDAAASAAALAIVASRMGRRARVLTPGGATHAARALLERLSVAREEDAGEVLRGAGAVILVDAGSLARAGAEVERLVRERGLPVLIIDHHRPREEVGGAQLLVDEGASSTSEIVARELLGSFDVRGDVACALAAGILTDTGGLAAAGCRTLEVYARLCGECGRPPSELRSSIHPARDPSEAVAVLKGLQRMRIVALGDWIVAISSSGSHHASVARALVRAGADVGIALGRSDGGTEGSLRSSRAFARTTGIHLGDLAAGLAEGLGGSGGGHAGAASFRARAGPGAVTDRLLDLLGKSLNLKPRDVV
ncbi:MAG: DHH family phosphoesterase [Conexivisphaera sp.]